MHTREIRNNSNVTISATHLLKERTYIFGRGRIRKHITRLVEGESLSLLDYALSFAPRSSQRQNRSIKNDSTYLHTLSTGKSTTSHKARCPNTPNPPSTCYEYLHILCAHYYLYLSLHVGLFLFLSLSIFPSFFFFSCSSSTSSCSLSSLIARVLPTKSRRVTSIYRSSHGFIFRLQKRSSLIAAWRHHIWPFINKSV